ncbi:MAG: peptide-methionine (R)-S-oxide reductase MsrB [Candidatus Saccharimonadales bacterium]
MDELTDEQWQERLSPARYRILRQGETELPGSGTLLHNSEHGSYSCAACHQVLFDSETKFDSSSGWPSFCDVKDSERVKLVSDSSHGMSRIEVRCKRCGSHLGHLFSDGPQPTGQRYCINSLALDFDPDSSDNA